MKSWAWREIFGVVIENERSYMKALWNRELRILRYESGLFRTLEVDRFDSIFKEP